MFDWGKIESWANTTAASGNKAIIHIAMRCEDVAVDSERWVAGQRGDVCTPPWALTDFYAPITESVTGLSSACLDVAGRPPKRLNYLNVNVTAAMAEFVTALVNRYKNDSRIGAVEWGPGYQAENKPGAKSTACDLVQQMAAYNTEYETIRPAYDYLRTQVYDDPVRHLPG